MVFYEIVIARVGCMLMESELLLAMTESLACRIRFAEVTTLAMRKACSWIMSTLRCYQSHQLASCVEAGESAIVVDCVW